MNIKTLGIDLAKNVFQLHGVDEHGKVVFKKKMSRTKLAKFIANLPSCLIGMESCGGSNYWGRKFRSFGHDVKLISPQFVKPYVKSNKNDEADSEAICEAVERPNMRFVAIKTVEQQDIQMVHRIRSRLIKQRTALINQIRGLLGEYGIVIAQGITHVRKQLPMILEGMQNELSPLGRHLFGEQLCELYNMDEQVKTYDRYIDTLCAQDETCQRLIKLEGIGALTATALVASIGDATLFENGREMSAFVGLVPRQHSSGGQSRLLGISKRGDRYLRCLLVHGARAVIHRCKNLSPQKAAWLKELVAKKGKNRAAVALANKNVRILWALIARGEEYSRTA